MLGHEPGVLCLGERRREGKRLLFRPSRETVVDRRVAHRVHEVPHSNGGELPHVGLLVDVRDCREAVPGRFLDERGADPGADLRDRRCAVVPVEAPREPAVEGRIHPHLDEVDIGGGEVAHHLPGFLRGGRPLDDVAGRHALLVREARAGGVQARGRDHAGLGVRDDREVLRAVRPQAAGGRDPELELQREQAFEPFAPATVVIVEVHEAGDEEPAGGIEDRGVLGCRDVSARARRHDAFVPHDHGGVRDGRNAAAVDQRGADDRRGLPLRRCGREDEEAAGNAGEAPGCGSRHGPARASVSGVSSTTWISAPKVSSGCR